MTQIGRVLNELKKAGNKGVTNHHLSRLALKYTSVISELRHDGYDIYCERQRFIFTKRFSNTYRYYLIDEPDNDN